MQITYMRNNKLNIKAVDMALFTNAHDERQCKDNKQKKYMMNKSVRKKTDSFTRI